jgi:hypothetical protein
MFSPELPAQDVRALKESKDVPGLMRLLRNCDGRVRSSAAVVLSGVIRQIDDEKTLARHIQPLIDATLRDPYSSVREYAGRALQHCLQNVTDASVMAGAAAPLIDALNATEVDAKRRRYCAVQLSRVIPHVQQDSLLEQSVPMLLSATLNDPDETVREYAGRALKNALTRVSDTKLLHTGCVALARTHKHKDPRRRGYAAVLLSWLASRVKELDTLRAILDPIRNAAERDSNETVREYAGRATRDITRRLEAADAESNGPAKP